MTARFEKQGPAEKPTLVFKGKVLLVDEDLRELGVYCALLEGQGFEVLTCPSFDDGARQVQEVLFDFILVGQGSSAFEGRSVLERAMELDRRTRVVVLTRALDMNCYLEAMQLGAVDYLEKPLPPVALLRLVEAHVRSRRVMA